MDIYHPIIEYQVDSLEMACEAGTFGNQPHRYRTLFRSIMERKVRCPPQLPADLNPKEKEVS
jgi:hypothetical protein